MALTSRPKSSRPNALGRELTDDRIFVDGSPIEGQLSTTQTDLSAAIARALKARGFKFVGPTIVYAWMQAVGLTNDHEDGCFRRHQIRSSEVH